MHRQTSEIIESIVATEFFDSLYKKINELSIDPKSKDTVLEAIEGLKPKSDKIKRTFNRSIKRASKDKDAPKKVIAESNRCTAIAKSGNPCAAPRTNNITMKCWGHMTSEEKEEHNKRKLESKETPKKEIEQKKEESKAPETKEEVKEKSPSVKERAKSKSATPKETTPTKETTSTKETETKK